MDNLTDNNVISQEQDYLTFGKIWKFIKKSFVLSLIVAIVGLIIGIAVCIPLYNAGKHSFYQNIISYNYDGINEQKAPNGGTFNKNELISTDILEKAITASGLQISAQDLKNVLSVNEMYSNEIKMQIDNLKELSKKDPDALVKLKELEASTDTYQLLYFDVNNVLNLNDTDINKLLGCISEEYTKAFNNKYFGPTQLNLLTVSSNTEYMNIYQEYLDTINNDIQLLQTMAKDYPTYKDAASNKSFSSMASSLEIYRDMYLNPIYSRILSDPAKQVFNDIVSYKKSVELQYTSIGNKMEALKSKIDATSKLIEQQTSGNSSTTGNNIIINLDDKAFQKLVKEKQMLDDEYSNLLLQQLTTKELLDKIGTSTSCTQSDKTEVEALINTAKTKLNEILTSISTSINKFYESGFNQNMVNCKTLPATTFNDMSKKVVALGIIISTVLGYLLGMLIFYIKYKNKAKKA